MAALTIHQQDEVIKLVEQHTSQLNALSSAQRKEVQEIFDQRDQASSLSSAQKWDVAAIVAKMAGGFGAVLGIASYFAVVNAARDAALNLKADETATAMLAKPEFTKLVTGKGSFVVAGSVIAFDVSTGCPAGWSEYSNAIGRSIIGLGQKGIFAKHIFQEQGGAEQHILSQQELPPIKFNVNVSSAVASTVDRYNAGGHDYPVVVTTPVVAETNTIGAGSPFSTLSPYVALYYCRKD